MGKNSDSLGEVFGRFARTFASRVSNRASSYANEVGKLLAGKRQITRACVIVDIGRMGSDDGYGCPGSCV